MLSRAVKRHCLLWSSRMNPKTRIFLSLLLLVHLAACDRVPDCDDRGAEKLMARTVYRLTAYALCDTGSLLGYNSPIPTGLFPAAMEMSPRHAAITDMYFPSRMIALDRNWLRPRIAAQMLERYRALNCLSSLIPDDFEAIRRAVGVRLVDHERLPDRMENGRTYTKVCRAKLIIEPAVQSDKVAEAITLTYSLNPSPLQNFRFHTNAGPFYVPVNFFEATEPPLLFPLSDNEKMALMTMGAARDIQAKPESPSPDLRIQRRALRAFREYFEHTEVSPTATPNPAIDRASPGKPDAIPRMGR